MVFKRLQTPFEETNLGKAIAQYDKTKAHRFYNQTHSLIILLVYEILLAISWEPEVMNYNAVDAWFTFLQSFVKYGTLLFSLVFIFIYGWQMSLDLLGRKNRKERKKDREEKKKKEKEGKKDWKPEAKKPIKVNIWYLGPFILGEALFWAFALYCLLQYLVFGLLLIPFEEIHIATSLPGVFSLRHLHSNPVQDVALAFGAGYYEEFIFRGLLFMLIAWAAGKYKPFNNLKIGLKNVEGIPLRYPEFKGTEGKFINALLVAVLIYSISHYLFPFADTANAYTFIYRTFFGVAMYLIFVFRGWAVLIWSHTFYDLMYFVFVGAY